MTIEALILSAADDLDAKIDQVRRHVADDEGEGEFTAFHPRLRRLYRHNLLLMVNKKGSSLCV